MLLRRGDAPALDLAPDAARVATLLRDVPADRAVLVGTEDDAAFVRVALGAARAGRALLPLDPRTPAAEARRALARAGIAFVDPGAAERWPLPDDCVRHVVAPDPPRSAWERLTGKRRPSTLFPGLLADVPAAPPAPQSPDAPAIYLRTSGTTGEPKLVVMRQSALAAQLDTLAAALAVDACSRFLNVLPFAHIDGLVMGLHLCAHTGATLLRIEGSPVHAIDTLLDVVFRERATHLVTVPAVLALLQRSGEDLRAIFDVPTFRAFVSTASPLPDPTWTRLEAATGKPVINVYGLTETGNLLFAGPDDASRVPGTVGYPRDCEARIVDEAGADAAEGELWLRGPSVLRVYADGTSPLRDGDWYPTGDVATRDDAGRYRIVGRRRALISVGGLKVGAAEVEAVLLAAPGVRDAWVHGEAEALLGERVVAELVVDAPDEDAILAHAREHLAEVKVPRELRFVERIERGQTGKVVWRPERAKPDQDVPTRVLDVAAAALRFPRARIDPSFGPDRIPGWDSVGHLDLLVSLEAAFGLTIPASQFGRVRTLADAIRLVEGRLG